MGFVYADIELINNDDLALVRRFIIGEEEVKKYKKLASFLKAFLLEEMDITIRFL